MISTTTAIAAIIAAGICMTASLIQYLKIDTLVNDLKLKKDEARHYREKYYDVLGTLVKVNATLLTEKLHRIRSLEHRTELRKAMNKIDTHEQGE